MRIFVSYVNAYQREHDDLASGNLSVSASRNPSACLMSQRKNCHSRSNGCYTEFQHGLTWLPTLLSAHFLNKRNPNMSPFFGDTNKSLHERGITLDSFQHGVDINLSLLK